MIKKIILSLIFLISSQYCFTMSGIIPNRDEIIIILKKEFKNQKEYSIFNEFAKNRLLDLQKKHPYFASFLNPKTILSSNY